MKYADLDNDGDDDLICSSFDDEKVSWYPNLGNGTFGDQILIHHQYAMAMSSVHPADFDGDGNIDVVFCGLNFGVRWCKNLGGGNFGSWQTITNTLNNTESVYAADLDGDGHVDVLAASSWDSKISWYKNNGSGSFTAQPTINNGASGASDVYAADLDNDGDLDVLSSAYYDDQISWYENNGVLGFGPEQVISANADYAYRVVSQDIDNDGNMDVVSASQVDNKIAWYKNLGNGVFGSENIVSTSSDDVYGLTVTDINGDGNFDILAASHDDDKVAWFENSGTGTFGAEQIISSSENGATSAITIDSDLDGDQDVIVGARFDAHIASYENAGGGTFNVPVEISGSCDNTYEIQMVDIDNDGDKDLVCWLRMSIYLSGPGEIVWYENLNNSTFAEQELLLPLLFGVGTFGHLDNDSLIDYATINNGNVEWYKNLGGGNYSSAISLGTASIDVFKLCISDCDNDSDNEILIATSDDTKIGLFENLGNGSFGAEQVVSSITDGAGRLITWDVDNDGDRDILVLPAYDNDIAFHENLGGLSFGPKQTLGTAGGIGMDGKGDFADLDGDYDLDVYYTFGGLLRWKENINGTYTNLTQINTNSVASGDLYAVHCTDFDNDGDLDFFTGTLFYSLLYKNNGNGVYSFEQIITNQSSYYVEAITSSDLDSDGDEELFVASWNDDKIIYFENFQDFNESLEGKVFLDLNNDGTQSPSESGAPQIGIFSSPQSGATFTDSNGDFEMNFSNSLGGYTIFPQTIPHWSISTNPLTYSVTIDSTTTLIDSLCFGITPDSSVVDIVADISGGQALCSSANTVWLNLQNVGTTNPSGVICLELDPDLTFNNASTVPDSIQGQNYYWHYDSLDYFGLHQISLQLDAPASTPANELESILTVFSIDQAGSINFQTTDSIIQSLSCNTVSNNKTAMPIGVDSLGYVSSLTQELVYTIYFQNTTSDTITNFSIKDIIDNNLNLNSFSPISSSHPYQLDIDLNGEVVFSFENIILPDSASNNSESFGFVTYSILPDPNLQPGTSVYNTAVFCMPISPQYLTNTTIHTLYDCSTSDITNPTPLCVGDSLNLEFTEGSLQSSVQWEIPSVLAENGASLNWQSDTSGVFDLFISASNGVCNFDSVITVAIYPDYSTDLGTTEVCFGDSAFVFSQYISSDGVYVDSLQSILGCDSIVQMTIVMLGSINNATNVASDTILGANAVGATYQWLDCTNNYAVIPGETSQSFTATSNGEYAVEITLSGCSDTSQCIVVSTISIDEYLPFGEVTIYPNPTDGYFTLDLSQQYDKVNLELVNSLGQVVAKKELLNVTSIESRIDDKPGLYFLRVITDQHSVVIPLVKK